MTVSSTMEINGETIDLNDPCSAVLALKKVRINVIAGLSARVIRGGDEEVTFTQANVSGLEKLINEFEKACREKTGGRKIRGQARGIRWRA